MNHFSKIDEDFIFNRGRQFLNVIFYFSMICSFIKPFETSWFRSYMNMDPYHADIQSLIDSYNLSPKPSPNRKYSSQFLTNSSISIERDPSKSENLTDDFRWLLIQYGPYQPRDNEDEFLASAKTINKKKGIIRFRSKWFDDIRFSDWLEYSLTTCRAYCFYCRLFADSNRNRAFSRDGIHNWRKCLGSRGQKKTRSIKSNENTIICQQRRGLLESHAMSESHKQAYQKYLTFIDERKHNGDNTNLLPNIEQEK